MKYKVEIEWLRRSIGWINAYDTDEDQYAYYVEEKDWKDFLNSMATEFKEIVKANALRVEE